MHFAQLAESLGVDMFSLGTESDGLFRTRENSTWPNHFRNELESMVAAVRSVYTGILSYDMFYDSVAGNKDFWGESNRWLWQDLGLDVIGLSAYFELLDEEPSSRASYESLYAAYQRVFADYLAPLSQDNPGVPIVFLEYGYVDSVRSPKYANSDAGTPKVFADDDQNGIDDGEETQRDIIAAFLAVNEEYGRLVAGQFYWDHYWADDDLWASTWVSDARNFPVRGNPAMEIVSRGFLTPPGTPQLTAVEAGNGALSLIVDLDDGGVAVTTYTAHCSDGTRTFTQESSQLPITVSGLENDTAYTCSVSASNDIGTGPWSLPSAPAFPEFMPSGMPVWLLLEGVSRDS